MYQNLSTWSREQQERSRNITVCLEDLSVYSFCILISLSKPMLAWMLHTGWLQPILMYKYEVHSLFLSPVKRGKNWSILCHWNTFFNSNFIFSMPPLNINDCRSSVVNTHLMNTNLLRFNHKSKEFGQTKHYTWMFGFLTFSHTFDLNWCSFKKINAYHAV